MLALLFLVRSYFKGTEAETNAFKASIPGRASKGGFEDPEPSIPPDQLKPLTIWNAHLANGSTVLRFQFRRNNNNSIPMNLAVVIVPEQGEKIVYDVQVDFQSHMQDVAAGVQSRANQMGQMDVRLGGGTPRFGGQPAPGPQVGPNARVYLVERPFGNSNQAEGTPISNVSPLRVR